MEQSIAEKKNQERPMTNDKERSIEEMSEHTGIRTQVISEICEFARQYDIDKVVLFGSRARGDYHRTSDIDLAVYGSNYLLFAHDVDEYTSTLLKYDIVDMTRPMNPALKQAIETEGIKMYEK